MTRYDEARQSGPHTTRNGVPYMLGTHNGASLRDNISALTPWFAAANIGRVCDGDNRQSYATLPDRYTATVEDAQRWHAWAAELD
jgi:aminoglycoside/choline kinase family phosphotransferase